MFLGKYKKGDFEYYNNKKLQTIILTIIYFAISFSLYGIGIYTTGSNKNLLTIIAVLGMLPASKSAVSMIMYIRYHGCSNEIKSQLEDCILPFKHAYGLVLTTYKKNYEIPVCIIKNNYIYMYVTNHTDDLADLKKHINDMVKQNGYKGFADVFTNTEDFKKRLLELAKKEDDDQSMDDGLMTLMHQISL